MKKLFQRISNFIFGEYSSKTLPRFWILSLDIFLTTFSYVVIEFVVYFPFKTSIFVFGDALKEYIVLIVFYIISFLIFKTYKVMMRFTEFNDIKTISIATFTATAAITIAKFLMINMGDSTKIFANSFFPPYSIIFYHFALTFAAMTLTRLFIRGLYIDFYKYKQVERNNKTIIYGAGDAGIITMRAIIQDNSDYKIVAFVDDNKQKQGITISNIPINSCEQILNKKFIEKHKIQTMIYAIPSTTTERKREIFELALSLGLKIKSIPPLSSWIDNTINIDQLKDIKIEDLLGRKEISLDDSNVKNEIRGKRVMVTGAAGSIGSEICRQIMHYDPELLIMIDQAESPLYDFQFELLNSSYAKDKKDNMVFEVANVKDHQRMREIFNQFKPQAIYHAAAYKHVPFMEQYPYESVYVNVFGTKNIADLAIENNVEKFVMISTDKAVRPTNVMGATKRIAEIYTQSRQSKTKFITTRFGNVLGSNGSVIPLFKKQLANGGPLTVTDFRITRYFMTIPEACNLVLQASSLGTNDEIFIFDMGKPVRIYDLAQRMIELSDKDAQIVEIGLRPGEKLIEELLNTSDNTKKTPYEKIMIADVKAFEKTYVDTVIEELHSALESGDDMKIVAQMKKISPDYVSNNSVFCKLDEKN